MTTSLEHPPFSDGRLPAISTEARLVRALVDNQRLRGELERALTERARLERELGEARVLEALGRQAVGVAHDLNNAVCTIAGFSQLLLARLGAADETCRRAVEGIRTAADWGTSLTRQLLATYRDGTLAAAPVDLNATVEGRAPLLRLLVGEPHRLEIRLEPGLPPVSANAAEIEQVLVNLVVNARDALAGPGVVTVTTRCLELDAASARRVGDLRAGWYVRLAVGDTGRGIDGTTLAHLFEAHFSTKEGGNGLGLATVRDIVTRCGGGIRVVSEQARGSTFEVYLPAAEVGPVPAERCAGAGGGDSAGGETVLVVEDEVPVRELIHDVLRLHGYTVLLAGDGAEALSVSERHAGAIHLMIVDVVMPGLSGEELARRIAAARPGIKTVYVSGYTGDLVRQHGLLPSGRDFLQKPFTVDELARKVREVLDAP